MRSTDFVTSYQEKPYLLTQSSSQEFATQDFHDKTGHMHDYNFLHKYNFKDKF